MVPAVLCPPATKFTPLCRQDAHPRTRNCPYHFQRPGTVFAGKGDNAHTSAADAFHAVIAQMQSPLMHRSGGGHAQAGVWSRHGHVLRLQDVASAVCVLLLLRAGAAPCSRRPVLLMSLC